MGTLGVLRVWVCLLAVVAAAVAARSLPNKSTSKRSAATQATALTADSAAAPPASAATATAATATPATAAAAAAGGGDKDLVGTALLQDTETFGWQSAENQLVRHYVCRYSKDGAPCRERSHGQYPQYLQCPPNHCCSKSHMVYGLSGQWCVAQWVHCNGLLNYPNWSYGLCTCERYGHQCVDNSVCRQEDAPLGGAYCVCKDGYLGDGTYCYEDKCRSQPCYPGTCVLINEEVHCNCPENYEVDRSKMPQGCKVKDMCQDSPCGDIKSTKACYHEGPGRYSCECNLGYVAVEVNGKIKCDDIFNHFVCSSSPCGATGVQECLDTPSGVKCTCMPGYNLVKETARYSCVREDPCLSSPCGTTDIVSSCVATSASYVCTCKDGYKVVSGDNGQYCAVSEAETNYVLYAGIGGGVLILLFAVFACNYMRQGPELTEEEVQFMQQNGGDGVSDVAFFDTSGGWQ
ncbi:hypothetical protein Emed_002171 [Eimeria media]